MTSIGSISHSELARRRHQLRRARRLKVFQSGWQALAVMGLAGGMFWVTTLPGWLIRQPDQVEIEGNQYLSDEAIRSLLPLSYPQSLLKVEPQAIAQSLESHSLIAKATVIRQLLPPSLTVQVAEHYPVAVAVSSGGAVSKNTAHPLLNPGGGDRIGGVPNAQIGLLDENGLWIPLTQLNGLERSPELPNLTIIGNPEQYRLDWPEIYKAIQRSPVPITEIDWQNPANLILKTEIATLHLGPYTSRFSQQLEVLARMRDLPAQINPSQIAYIDLKNPSAPAINMVSVTKVAPVSSP